MGWTPQMRSVGLLAALATLSACQALPIGTPRPYTPTFRVEALPARPGDAPWGPGSGGSAGTVAVNASGTTPATAGQLIVNFGHLLPPAAQRRLLATIADVDRITITLSGNGVSHTETIPKAAIVNGMTSFTFTGLPAGTLTVTIKALDAAGAVIGRDIQQATVTAGQTTTVTSTVPLTPTVPTPQVIVGSSGGSGGSGGSTGSLTTNVTLRDDIPVITPTVLGVYAPGMVTTPPAGGEFHANTVVLDNQGNAWFGGDFSHENEPGDLGKVTPAGAFSLVATTAPSWWWLRASLDGARIITAPDAYNGSMDYGVRLDGNPVSAATSLADTATIAEAPDGSLYALKFVNEATGVSQDIIRIAPDGSQTVVHDSPAMDGSTVGKYSFDVYSDRAGNAVITGAENSAAGWQAKNLIMKYQPDGTQIFSHTFEDQSNWLAMAVAIDSQNNIWAVDGEHQVLRKLSPTGALLGTFATGARCNRLYIDALDRVWAYESAKIGIDRAGFLSLAPTDVVSRFSSAGVLEAYYSIGQDTDTEELAVSADDHMWVASKNKGLIHLQLAPLP